MKKLYTILILTLLTQSAFAQKIVFVYNEAGLRIKRGSENALPVTLIHFTASKIEGDFETAVLLRWETSAEINSNRFEIERSKDAKNWTNLASVAARGNWQAGELYEFKDETPHSGSNYYRLKMIDTDQSFAYSQIRHVKVDTRISIFPNPVENVLHIGEGGHGGIQIFNTAGQLVLESSGDLSGGIDVSRLPGGFYILKFSTVSNSETGKFFKN